MVRDVDGRLEPLAKEVDGNELDGDHRQPTCLHRLMLLADEVDEGSKGMAVALGGEVPLQAVCAKGHEDVAAQVELMLAIAVERPCVTELDELFDVVNAVLAHEGHSHRR